MRKFQELRGIAAPFYLSNVNTDVIIPKKHMTGVTRIGLGKFLFEEARYLDDQGTCNPDCYLNHDGYQSASILIAGDNFGCGSSREHAVWALDDFGFRCIIAPSFSDIFFNNCIKNGLLPVVLDSNTVRHFATIAEQAPLFFSVSLKDLTVTDPHGTCYTFNILTSYRECLLEGYDEISVTMKYKDIINTFVEENKSSRPWLF